MPGFWGGWVNWASHLLGLGGDQDIDRYIHGYATQPETTDEVEAARAAAAKALAAEPWE